MRKLWQRILDYDDGLLGPRWAAAGAALYLVLVVGVIVELARAVLKH